MVSKRPWSTLSQVLLPHLSSSQPHLLLPSPPQQLAQISFTLAIAWFQWVEVDQFRVPFRSRKAYIHSLHEFTSSLVWFRCTQRISWSVICRATCSCWPCLAMFQEAWMYRFLLVSPYSSSTGNISILSSAQTLVCLLFFSCCCHELISTAQKQSN